MSELEKTSRRKQCILDAVIAALEDYEYSKLTIEEIAARAGVGKSTIYRWWKHKSDLVFEAFKQETASVFELNYAQSLEFNLKQQLLKLSHALNRPIGRALMVVLSEHREAAGAFFSQYLLPRREATRKLIQLAIEQGEIRADYPFEMMLDTLYAPIHYQMIFFNRQPDEAYIQALLNLVLQPARINATPQVDSK